MYGYWSCEGKCMDFDCVEVSVWILVVCRDKSMDFGYVKVSVWILVV